MPKRPIVHIPEPVLVTPAKTVTAFDAKLRDTIADMVKTLKAATNPKGVGLAAVQVGIPYRIFVTRPTPSSPVRAFVNPEILESDLPVVDHEREDQLEGCLSIPGVWGYVKRSQSLTLKYEDETGKPVVERFSGFMATIVQHETDHCNGILFTRRVVEQHGKLYQSVYGPRGKETLEEIHLG
jgi:peptide deformylase